MVGQKIMATITLVTLAIYEIICICRILGKQAIIEKIWKKIFPNKKYNEKIFFVFIRPIFLQVSFLGFLLSGTLLSSIEFQILISFAPILAIASTIAMNKK